MSEIQKYEIPNLDGRVETGPVQFNDDWPGVFIRGDQCAYFALNLKDALITLTELHKKNDSLMNWLTIVTLEGLLSELSSPIIDSETLRWLE